MKQPLALMLVVLVAAQASAADFRAATAHLKAQQHPNSRRGINFSLEQLRLVETHLALELRWGFNLPDVGLASGVLEGKYVLNEVDGVAGTQRRYHYGGMAALAIADAQGTRFLNLDALGSPTQETNSSTGAVSKVRQTDAWGRYRNGTAPGAGDAKYGFTGHQYDVESGLTYARARYYDAETGRMLSRDLVDGDLNNAPSLHAYAWAFFNPLRYTDFEGLAPTTEETIANVKRAALANAQPNAKVLGVPEEEVEKTFKGLQQPLKKSLTRSEQVVVETREGIVSLQKKFILVATLGLGGSAAAGAESLAFRFGLGRVGTAGLTVALEAGEAGVLATGSGLAEQAAEVGVDARDSFDVAAAAKSGGEAGVSSAALGLLLRKFGLGPANASPRGSGAPPPNLDESADDIAKWLAARQKASAEGTTTATSAEGFVYKRTNPKTGDPYVGQAKSPERFDARQGEHDSDLGVQHEYEILGRATKGRPLDVLEETKIRELGGLQREGGPLVNKRHQMSEKRFRDSGGSKDDPNVEPR